MASVAVGGFIQLRDELVRAVEAAGSDPVARLAASGEAYVRFATDHPSHFRVMFSGSTEPGRYPDLDTAGQSSADVLTQALLAVQETGKVPHDDLGLLVVSAWALVHGLATLLVDGMLPQPGDSAAPADIAGMTRAVISVFHKGLIPG